MTVKRKYEAMEVCFFSSPTFFNDFFIGSLGSLECSPYEWKSSSTSYCVAIGNTWTCRGCGEHCDYILGSTGPAIVPLQGPCKFIWETSSMCKTTPLCWLFCTPFSELGSGPILHQLFYHLFQRPFHNPLKSAENAQNNWCTAFKSNFSSNSMYLYYLASNTLLSLRTSRTSA